MEIWKDIKAYEGLCQISNNGNVKSLARIGSRQCKNDKILKPYKTGPSYKTENCYLSVYLCKNKIRKPKLVHRLVFEAFEGVINEGFVINHINGIKNDNRINNLESCTQKQNIKHSIDTGLKNLPRTSIIVLNTENGIYYDSIAKGANSIGISDSYLMNMLKGRQKNKTNFIYA